MWNWKQFGENFFASLLGTLAGGAIITALVVALVIPALRPPSRPTMPNPPLAGQGMEEKPKAVAD